MVYPLLEEIKMLYKQGEWERLIWKLRNLDGLPKDLYPIAADIIAQTILKFPSSWQSTEALYLATTRLKIPVEGPEGEQILSDVLQKALDPATEYRGDLIRHLGAFDDPRALETLVRLYKFEADGLKSDIVLALRAMGKEEALPVLLNYCFSQMGNYITNQSELLVKYPIVDDADGLLTEISGEDRDQVINILLAYLKETEPFADNMWEYLDLGNGPNITIACILDLLYSSPKTSPISKAKILANKNCWVDCYVVDYQHEVIGHRELGSYLKAGNRQKKRAELQVLGKVGDEATLLILLDNFVQQSKMLPDDQLRFLRKYRLENGFDDRNLRMNPADRNAVINILLNYLAEQEAYDDPLRIDVAHMLAILYASPITLYASKKKIKAMRRQNIFAIPQDSTHAASYISLSDFIEFTDGKSI